MQKRLEKHVIGTFFWRLDKEVSKTVRLCVLGGSGLTLLDMRETGSPDIDVFILAGSKAFQNGSDAVKRKLYSEEPLLDTSGEQVFNIDMDIFQSRLPSMHVPDSFFDRLHRVKRIPLLRNGEVQDVSHKEFDYVELFTPSVADFLATKFFSARKKDVRDLYAMLDNKLVRRYVKRYQDNVEALLNEYVEVNYDNQMVIRNMRGIYESFREEYDLLPELTY